MLTHILLLLPPVMCFNSSSFSISLSLPRLEPTRWPYAPKHRTSLFMLLQSFKFVRLFPLNQQDAPGKFKYKADTLKSVQAGQDLKEEHPWVDYTALP